MATTSLSVPDCFQPALAALLRSYDYAQDSGTDSWQFALELTELLATGATLADLRWLIHRSFAEHAKETTIAGDPARSFRPLARTNFPSDACVVLTTEGATTVRALLVERRTPPLRKGGQGGSRDNVLTLPPPPIPPNGTAARGAGFQPAGPNSPPMSKGGAGEVARHGANTSLTNNTLPGTARRAGFQSARNSTPVIPHYDAMLHELRLGDELVKSFTRPARAQELILQVFQEEGWPPAIDDPLPSQFNQDPKRHLHYTVRNLNRGQTPLRIRFYINGHGETIRWEVISNQRAISAHRARQRR